MNTVLNVNGMTCQSCARSVRQALQAVEGVRSAEVNLDSGRTIVRGAEQFRLDPAMLVRAIEARGYSASVADSSAKRETQRAGSGWLFNVIFGLAISVPLMLIEWIFHPDMHGWFGWLSFALVLPVQLFCGWRFYRGAWQQLKVGQSNMDTLVALGSTTAFAFSVYALLAPQSAHHLYFAEAAAIITLISLGHYLEARAGEQAAGAVRTLLRLAPQTARRILQNNQEEIVPIAMVERDDKLSIRPGDQIPTDGIVEEGESAVDESMLTGESTPVDKTAGMELYTGTVNLNGRLVARVTGVGEETALAHIIEVVDRAQNSRAEIEKLGDRVSSIFVPAVILIALAVLFGFAFFSVSGWETGLIRAAAVLIVACPCAMGLATPAAIMAGTNAATKRGILIRDGTALEKCGRVTAVLFDKTSTLTEGKPRVQKSVAIDLPKAEVNALALALTRTSHHPLSAALAHHLSGIEPAATSEWKEHRGAGVSARYANRIARLGSLPWLRESGINTARLPADFEGTVLGLALETNLIAAYVLMDQAKTHTREVVDEIRASGLKPYVVSGDSELAVAQLAEAAGIPKENVFAEVRPEAKAAIVEKLQRAGERVAFVGDGINDAPALAQADLGIAVTKASDVAREAADILLLKSDIEAVPEAIGLCQATLRTIKQNLFWAFFYNAAAIPLAAAGFISPVVCAAAMALSDLFVIGNALRLLRWKK
jgi:Cu+-exporting ATPase